MAEDPAAVTPVPSGSVEPTLRLPSPEEIRAQDIFNNCAVRTVVSGVMGKHHVPMMYGGSIVFTVFLISSFIHSLPLTIQGMIGYSGEFVLENFGFCLNPSIQSSIVYLYLLVRIVHTIYSTIVQFTLSSVEWWLSMFI